MGCFDPQAAHRGISDLLNRTRSRNRIDTAGKIRLVLSDVLESQITFVQLSDSQYLYDRRNTSRDALMNSVSRD